MTNKENIAALDSCSYIFLVSHEEAPDSLDLRLVVHEARAEKQLSSIETGNHDLDQALGQGYAVKSDSSFRRFTITFEHYVGFAIRNEIYAETEPNEEFSKKLRTYSDSSFLEFIAKSTFAHQLIKKPILHFAVVCSDHVIDVACTDPPLIELNLISDSLLPSGSA